MDRTADISSFRVWRNSLGFNQNEAAKQLGISTRHVQRYDAGDKHPDQRTLLAMLAISKGLTIDERSAADVPQAA